MERTISRREICFNEGKSVLVSETIIFVDFFGKPIEIETKIETVRFYNETRTKKFLKLKNATLRL